VTGIVATDQIYTPADIATIVEVLRLDQQAKKRPQPDPIQEAAREMAEAMARELDRRIMEEFLGR
jgi:hypothetical protein